MEPFRKEIGRPGIANRDAGGQGHGVAFGEEPCRHVRTHAAIDLRGTLGPRLPRRHAVGLANAVDDALVEPGDGLAEKPPMGGPHLFGRALDEEQPFALPRAEHAVPGGVRATTSMAALEGWEETGMTISAAKLKTAAHMCVRSAAETSWTGSPVGGSYRASTAGVSICQA